MIELKTADERILWGVVANAGRLKTDGTQPRWAAVRDATGLGSTLAAELCGRFGFDPDELVGTEPEYPDPEWNDDEDPL